MSSESDIAGWDAEAGTFDEAPDHGLRDERVCAAWERLLVDKLPAPPARVADLGCGTGTLSLLLADNGYVVDGLDFSPEMVKRAVAKAAGRADVTLLQGDANDPPLTPGAYDIVLCRHVIWAMADPAAALGRWLSLLKPAGVLVLIEGRWSNDVGLTADETVALVRATGRPADLTSMDDPVYWGRPIDDERYLVVSPAS